MALTPLVIAGAAGALLVASVGVDIAFAQTLVVEIEQAGAYVEVARVTLDSDEYYSSPFHPETLDPVDQNGTLDVRITLHNEYPWPVSKTLTLSRDGCYEGARTLATLTVKGDGEPRSATVRVADLLSSASAREKPVPLQTTPDGGPIHVSLNVCQGDRYLATPTFPVEASS